MLHAPRKPANFERKVDVFRGGVIMADHALIMTVVGGVMPRCPRGAVGGVSITGVVGGVMPCCKGDACMPAGVLACDVR